MGAEDDGWTADGELGLEETPSIGKEQKMGGVVECILLDKDVQQG